MTARLSLFEHPLFLGFDHFEREFDRLKKTGGDSYPPYNVEQVGADDLRITLAVAGFSPEDLAIEIDNNQLTVRGRQPADKDRTFHHRGIAARPFQRGFVLADGIEVTGAAMEHGLLHIDMHRLVPESRIRKISIKNGNANAATSVELQRDAS